MKPFAGRWYWLVLLAGGALASVGRAPNPSFPPPTNCIYHLGAVTQVFTNTLDQAGIARWVLSENELAPTSFSIGGRLGYEDDGTTPNTQIVLHNYAKAPLLFEVRGLPASSTSDKMDNYHGASIGVVVDCEGGRVVIPS